ncbi:MAG: LysM peptidoglycan-binding domain-containing protein, partial [Cycloclasticus sp.]
AMQIQEIELSSYYTVKGLLTAFGVKNNIFKSLNPALQPTIWSNNKYVPKGYRLRVPVGALSASTNDLMASIPSNERGRRQKADFSYRVKRGDTLSKIAQRFKLSSRQLAALNNLKDRHKIRVGQVLRLPHAASQPKRIYQVRRGDNLSLIARKVGMLEADLLSLNKLKNRDLLYVGQRLRLK